VRYIEAKEHKSIAHSNEDHMNEGGNKDDSSSNSETSNEFGLNMKKSKILSDYQQNAYKRSKTTSFQEKKNKNLSKSLTIKNNISRSAKSTSRRTSFQR